MPRKPRGKRSSDDDGSFVVAAKNSNGDGSVYYEPTRRIVSMERAESSAMLKQLHLHATCPDQVYAHDWEEGDLIMFDTLGTMHRCDASDPSQRRLMRQLSTATAI